ncbi:MAG: hypothetical protein QOD63_98 [Actinomycetota bacterium]|jgi:archaellum component FlaG (FlaF/FlaG flagellin family)|nr:hypothetical protein [Actinomycetota bacterium]
MAKIVDRRIRKQGKAGTVVADVHAVVSTNVGGTAQASATSGRHRITVVQRNGHTEVIEEHDDPEKDL